MLLASGITFPERARLHSLRLHLVKVCELNRETWRFVRAETDDDHEWLPSPKQRGALGLPVRDEMIDGWLKAVDEFERLLKGQRLIDIRPPHVPEGMAFNVKAFLDDPPARLDVGKLIGGGGIDAKYLSTLTETNRYDAGAVNRVLAVFGDSLGVAYAVWFN